MMDVYVVEYIDEYTGNGEDGWLVVRFDRLVSLDRVRVFGFGFLGLGSQIHTIRFGSKVGR